MIGVGISHGLLEMDSRSIHFQLREDVFSWLTEYAGHGSQIGGFTPDCKWMWTYRASDLRGAVVVFMDPDAAALFKLRWG